MAQSGQLVAAQSVHFAVVDGILYFTDIKCGNLKRVVPQQLQQQILQEGYGGLTGGHLSGKRTYTALAQHCAPTTSVELKRCMSAFLKSFILSIHRNPPEVSAVATVVVRLACGYHTYYQ